MCGITGIVAKNSREYQNRIEKMVQALAHRGPDENGIVYYENCALGHTRLSIIDLSSGKQPMVGNNSYIAITFNGEIYGYNSIKDELSDYPFKTKSDTEIILALYEKYGRDMLPKLPGMFAFAIWNDEKGELFAARDRFGEKPFYYALGNNGELVFASEIKAILASELVKPVLDSESLNHYLKRLYVHPHKTIYKNIFSLPPACSLSFKDNSIKIDRYWKLPEINQNISIDEAKEKFEYLLDQAVQKQMVSDVPLGVFLSGGLDSSTVVALASKYKKDLMTISFGFDGYSELPYAQEISNIYNTNHIELHDDNIDIADLLMEMQNIYDEPFADSSNIPTYLISKLARKHATVMLGGDAGDELLAGYTTWYRPLYYMKEFKKKSPLSLNLEFYFNYLLDRLFKIKDNDFIYKRTGLSLAKNYETLEQAHYTRNTFYNSEQIKNIALYDFKENSETDKFRHNSFDEVLKADIENYMAGDILVKTDRAAMASALELRAPFLDVDFASFCISLPYSLKINKERDKVILREVFENKWGESVRKRSKAGFGAPVSSWLKRDSLSKLKHNYLDDREQKIFKFISFEASREFVLRNDYHSWILLVLAIWMDKHEFDF